MLHDLNKGAAVKWAAEERKGWR